MPKHEGDHVKAGEVVAELDPATYQSAGDLAEAKRDAAKAQLDELLAARGRRYRSGEGQSCIGAGVARRCRDHLRAPEGPRVAQRVVTATIGRRAHGAGWRARQGGADRGGLDRGIERSACGRYRRRPRQPARRRGHPGAVAHPARAGAPDRAQQWHRHDTGDRTRYTSCCPPPPCIRWRSTTRCGCAPSCQNPCWPRRARHRSDADHDGGHAYHGRIGYVSPQAEFTPKTVETPELRTQLVYRLRIRVTDPDAGVRQGMPMTIQLPPGK